MSLSIRVSTELVEAAKRQGTLFHRSPPQQIEHWAAIGQVMEAALSFPALEKVVRSVGRAELDQAMSVIGSPEGIAKARKVIDQAPQSKSARRR